MHRLHTDETFQYELFCHYPIDAVTRFFLTRKTHPHTLIITEISKELEYNK